MYEFNEERLAANTQQQYASPDDALMMPTSGPMSLNSGVVNWDELWHCAMASKIIAYNRRHIEGTKRLPLQPLRYYRCASHGMATTQDTVFYFATTPITGRNAFRWCRFLKHCDDGRRKSAPPHAPEAAPPRYWSRITPPSPLRPPTRSFPSSPHAPLWYVAECPLPPTFAFFLAASFSALVLPVPPARRLAGYRYHHMYAARVPWCGYLSCLRARSFSRGLPHFIARRFIGARRRQLSMPGAIDEMRALIFVSRTFSRRVISLIFIVAVFCLYILLSFDFHDSRDAILLIWYRWAFPCKKLKMIFREIHI